MSGMQDMGTANEKHGICGITSTLYAVYQNMPSLQDRLGSALSGADRDTRLMGEIKTFLRMMKADGKNSILTDITELTQTFPNYEGWSVELYIKQIDDALSTGSLSMAMPPDAVVEYIRTMWGMKAKIEMPVWYRGVSGPVILGLTRTGAPRNRWNNLAHYVYKDSKGIIHSWGKTFKDMATLNKVKNKDYKVIYHILVSI
jgi:hypothetical protein